MSVLWTSDEIAQVTGGAASASFAVSGLSIDTRALKAGDLFVPIKDARDGHDFMDNAFTAGAGGALSEIAVDHPHIRVSDSFEALKALGHAGRDRSHAMRIAVTGSVGKTSVKDALAVMLASFGDTHKSDRSFNNHLGVPITLATLPQETDYAVFETGMNHAGELTDLSRQVAPHIALITNVEAAHMAHFDGIEQIADAKAEIRHGLVAGGTLIVNADNPQTPRILEAAKGINVLTFGHTGAVKIVESSHTANGAQIALDIDGVRVDVSLNLSGTHWDHNVAACLAAAQALKLDIQKAAFALSQIEPSQGRGDQHAVRIAGHAVTLIDQSYNANPASMRAAIAAAALMEGRKIAVLGDMYELGADEIALHASLAVPLTEAGFARVITTGECMRALRGALPRNMRAALADDLDAVMAALRDEVQSGDVILIKGSNATGLSKLTAALKTGET